MEKRESRILRERDRERGSERFPTQVQAREAAGVTGEGRARGGRRYERRRSGGGAGGGSPGRLSPVERFPRRLPPPAAPSICIGVACTSRTLAGLVPTGFLCYLCVPFGGDRREIFTMARASGWLLWRPDQRSCKEEPRSSFGFLLALLVRILLLVLPFFVCSPLPFFW